MRHGRPGAGVVFRAGPGVGTVTLPGLPLEVGEPAINPVPRAMMRGVVEGLAQEHGVAGDVEVEVSVDHGEEIARHTWNPRLGILGGLSILGTTGVVVPYSCSAWIDSIRRGIDVAAAIGLTHVAACTGSTSEQVVMREHGLAEGSMLDMGDFAGAVLKYLRRHPLPRLTVAGGFAKMSKLAAGHLDLHSGRSQVDTAFLADLARRGRRGRRAGAAGRRGQHGPGGAAAEPGRRRAPGRPRRDAGAGGRARGAARRAGGRRHPLHRPGRRGGGPGGSARAAASHLVTGGARAQDPPGPASCRSRAGE